MTYSLNDAKMVYFQSLGYTGTAGDMELQWLHALTGDAYPGATIQDLLGILSAALGFTDGTTQEKQQMVMEVTMQDFYTCYNEAQQQFYSQGSTFSPVTLFDSGEEGAWYDPAALGTLFQDSAGTIPVTGVGEPVGKMLDRSGNGHHMIQTVGARRPILREDSNGNLYLEFNGTDSMMYSTDTVNYAATTKMTIVVAAQRDDTTTADSLVEQGVGNAQGTNIAGWAGSAGPALGVRNASVAEFAAMSGWAALTPAYFTCMIDRTQATVDLQLTAYKNAVLNAATKTGTAVTPGSFFENSALYLGARSGVLNPLYGRIYQCLVVEGILSGADLTNINAWTAARTGL